MMERMWEENVSAETLLKKKHTHTHACAHVHTQRTPRTCARAHTHPCAHARAHTHTYIVLFKQTLNHKQYVPLVTSATLK